VGACRGEEVGFHNAERVGVWGYRCTFLSYKLFNSLIN
jgi:hypothetical protein